MKDIQYIVYVLEDVNNKSWYIGYTTDIQRRIQEHNQGIGGQYSQSQKTRWKLIYVEGYVNKLDAVKRERFLKSGSGRRFIKKQIINYLKNAIHQ